MNRVRSEQLFEQARKYIPGGVDSPVRAFKSVGGTPLFIKRAKGSRIYDEDGNEFIDYVCSWGPIILGHAPLRVVKAVQRLAESGTSFGAPTELETRLAKMIREAVPSIELVRFVNSGTEATMSALRIARAFTGRDKIVKFAGCYHGHSDGLLARAGSGATTLGVPDSPGVPEGYTRNTLLAGYNDLDSVRELFNGHDDIAAVIVEPVAANMGVVPPAPGFLTGLRELTSTHGALLIFDEVITGFRLSYGGAQEYYGVIPDLTCLGKIIGGGLPVGAYGGRADIMGMVSPSGPVYQAGTLSGNPLAMGAGIETLRALSEPGVYAILEQKASWLQKGIEQLASEKGGAVRVSRAGSLMTLFFNTEPVIDYESATRSNVDMFAQFHGKMLEEGVYWPPSQYEAVFVSLSHSDEDLEATISAVERAL
ncbi:MAG: glutamate-1-semialdehyde 2,1-aminomutase [Dehalococcoidia bacterium]